MFAFLLILPTLAFVPIHFFIFPAIYIIAKKSIIGDYSYLPREPFNLNFNFLLILLIISASAVNKLFHWWDELAFTQILPYTIAMILTYFLSSQLNRRDLQILVWFIIIEAIVVCVQYFIGINTFFSSLDHFNENILKNPDLMYNRRPLGLSANSSVIAYKLLIAYIILDYLRLKNLTFKVLRVVLILGIVFTFNRTVFLVFIIYVIFTLIKVYGPIINNLLDQKIKIKHVKYLIFGIVSLVVLTVLFTFYSQDIYAQLTRGRSGGVDLSGRDSIWKGFVDFISENLFFGNGSEKFYVSHSGKLTHAHNSFLEVIATHGVLIFFMYLYLIFRNINHSNLVFVLLIIVYSMFQYGIFWGVSLMDIILFKLLFFRRNPN